jgi:hypothetical protein
MRDTTHSEFIDRWVEHMKTNPQWKKEHTEFIDAQFKMSEAFVERMLKEPNGKEKLREIYGIRNKKGFPSFF